jgi:fructan beta-fructosidase
MQQAERRARRGWLRRGARLAAVAAVMLGSAAGASAADTAGYQEPYRPQFHFTPAQNWMNDPNGLVYYKGEYHLFYQHNPFGDTWGHMSWGHAVSRDLVHWQHLPVAIPEQGDELAFSGSAVVDHGNTSGFGTAEHPPMVAIYTAATPGKQSQALAYSTDKGRTWTRYAGNPVLDIGSSEFRDPKVFWYEPEQKWVMAVVMAAEHKVRLYSSKDLKSWTLMSDFGPANAVGGAWECPDLFPLQVDGRTKWVLVVSINPGGIAGGSAGQYFVGDFDGTRFTADNVAGEYTPPAGELFQGFDGPTYDGWTATGNAFGDGPAAGNVPPQGGVAGYLGNGLANSFHDEDRGTGTLTSPEFTITKPFLNFLVGGGEHAYDPNAVDAAPPAGTVYADFEGDTYGEGWTATGTFAGTRPPAGTIGDQQPVTGYDGRQLVNTFIDHDNGTGHITSPEFTITKDYINFLVGGGNHPYPGSATNKPTAVNLIVDGAVVRTKTGKDGEALNWTNWNVAEFKGKTARIDIVDENTGGWGHINADQFTFADAPAFPRSSDTSVNLLVDGKVVRTTTGPNSETLDWRSWNLGDLIGKTARIQLADRNTGGWGHLLADHFTLADAAAQSLLDRSSWLDYGKDYYAAVSWNDARSGKRLMIGWMNNWLYANATPTSPWRSAMSVPREVTLRTVDGKVQLVQQPVASVDTLRTGQPHTESNLTVSGERTIAKHGDVLDIRATLRPGTAKHAGLKVLTNANGDETVVGYDAIAGTLYVDRTKTGPAAADLNGFPGVHSAPVKLRDGRLKLRILLDRSLIEVFAQDGERVIADQVYPTPGSDGLKAFATGGTATLESLDISELRTTWGARSTDTPGTVGGTVPPTLSTTTP